MEELNESKEGVKERKIDPVGLQIFGGKFKHFMKLADLNDLIPAFKEAYYQAKITGALSSASRCAESHALLWH